MTLLRIALAVGVAARSSAPSPSSTTGTSATSSSPRRRTPGSVRTAAPSTCTGFDEVAYEAHWERKDSVYRVTLFRAPRHGTRAVGGRPPAPLRVTPQTITTSRKKGYPARGCAPRPAARVVCSAGASWSRTCCGRGRTPRARPPNPSQGARAGLAPG
jgi:hypothetical protein